MRNYRLLPKRLNRAEKFNPPTFTFLAFTLLFLIIAPVKVFGQKTSSDDIDISIHVTNYFFAYDMKFKDGSYAVGPTLSYGTNEKIGVLIGVLVDTKKYIYRDRGGIMSYTPVEQINLFVPLTIQYNYFNSDKIELYVTGGFIFGGRNIIGEYNNAEETSIFNLTFGTGVSYRPFSWLALRTYPSVRYNLENFSPGVSVDIGYMFSTKKWFEM